MCEFGNICGLDNRSKNVCVCIVSDTLGGQPPVVKLG